MFVICLVPVTTYQGSPGNPDLPSISGPILQVEKELSEICSSILQLLDDHLIPTASSGESKVFYLKMKGDYHRYLAEFKTGTDRKDAAEHTLLAYKAAQVPNFWVLHSKRPLLGQVPVR